MVVKSASSDTYYDVISYICKSEDGGEFEIIVHSYLLENEQNLLPGDKIIVYGEGAGISSVYDNNGTLIRTSSVNMAYMILQGK